MSDWINLCEQWFSVSAKRPNEILSDDDAKWFLVSTRGRKINKVFCNGYASFSVSKGYI